MKKNIFCALDLDFKSALSLTKQIKDHIYGIKIGSLFNQIGIEGLKELTNSIFLSLLIQSFQISLLQQPGTFQILKN